MKKYINDYTNNKILKINKDHNQIQIKQLLKGMLLIKKNSIIYIMMRNLENNVLNKKKTLKIKSFNDHKPNTSSNKYFYLKNLNLNSKSKLSKYF